MRLGMSQRLGLDDPVVERTDISVVDHSISIGQMTMDCGIRYVQAVDIADERAGDGFKLGGKVDRGHVRAATAKQDDPIASIDGDESGDHENLIVHQQATDDLRIDIDRGCVERITFGSKGDLARIGDVGLKTGAQQRESGRTGGEHFAQ